MTDSSTDFPDARPQDDLYLSVNAPWLRQTQIPDDRARYGEFLLLAEGAEQAVREIVEEAAADPAAVGDRARYGAAFASFMDEAEVERRGLTPIAPALRDADAVQSVPELVETVGRLEEEGASGFFGAFVDTDPGHPERYIVFLTQGGLGLPDESYYREESFAGVRKEYRAHLERMFSLAGIERPGARADEVLALETKLAATHWDRVANREIDKIYNLRSFAQLQHLTPALDWERYLAAARLPRAAFDEVVVAQPSAFEGLSALLVPEELPAWRSWLLAQVLHGAAALLPRAFSEENFSFYGRTLMGTPEQRPRWKRAVGFVEGGLGEAVGREYVRRHFPPEAKQRMDALVGTLIEAYRASITALEWMGPETRTRALEKLDRFTPKIGYPSRWRDYSALTLDPADLWGNARALGRFETEREFAKIGRPVDRDEWFMTPQTVNAYYNPGMNEIVFPAAILQPPFFDPEADDAQNYGAIGAVIGHEIGHGFDDQGSKYDGTGALHDWWTEADRTRFRELTERLVAQYSALEPLDAPGHRVNGQLTLGENIGDLGGLAIAWKAYTATLDGSPAPVIGGRTAGERFFLAWARVWCEKRRTEEAVRLLTIDPHSPNDLRCNQIAKNLDAFHEAFGVHPGDGMWMDPADRVSIW
ncbi:MAG: peptidase M13 [Microbacteriaceae bacterium]|jgi:putative endopeptidase|nr:peptidase M13 [Microbacteriaceae bacterium]